MKIYYYKDEINDDFASTNGKINTNVVDKNYKYSNNNIFWKICSFFIYRIIVTPIIWVFTKFYLGIKIKNRKAIRSVKGSVFLYLNHTQNACDAFIPTIATFPKKAYIITSADTVSIKGIRWLVSMLGAVPLPNRYSGAKKFEARLSEICNKKSVITIFPEAHIWPYCNFIRHFSDKSFSYPYRHKTAVVAGVVVYRKRKLFKNMHPKVTLYLSEPCYPDFSIDEKSARTRLRDYCYSFMNSKVKEYQSYEYIRYEYKED